MTVETAARENDSDWCELMSERAQTTDGRATRTYVYDAGGDFICSALSGRTDATSASEIAPYSDLGVTFAYCAASLGRASYAYDVRPATQPFVSLSVVAPYAFVPRDSESSDGYDGAPAAQDHHVYAGDDPVNEGDPSGLLSSSALQDVADWALQNWNGGYNGFLADDCTDFASRALAIGGDVPETEPGSLKTAVGVARAEFWLGMVGSAYATVEVANHLVRGNLDYWYDFGFYGLPEGVHSDSWSVAKDLAQREVNEGGQVVVDAAQLPDSCATSNEGWSQVHPGDIIFTDFGGSSFGDIDHTGVVVGWSTEGLEAGESFTGPFSPSYQPGDHLWIAQHSPSQVTSLDYWLQEHSNMHVWIVNPANH